MTYFLINLLKNEDFVKLFFLYQTSFPLVESFCCFKKSPSFKKVTGEIRELKFENPQDLIA